MVMKVEEIEEGGGGGGVFFLSIRSCKSMSTRGAGMCQGGTSRRRGGVWHSSLFGGWNVLLMKGTSSLKSIILYCQHGVIGSLNGWFVGRLSSLVRCFELMSFLLISRGISPHSICKDASDVK